MAKGCSVFVGNIEFDIPEQKIVEELSVIGKVVNFRLVYDRNTGKSKGYGFAEYESSLIAETAVQKLKISFNGRPVKINYADTDFPIKSKETTATETLDIENIVNVLDDLDKTNLKDVVIYLKRMAIDQPSNFKNLMATNPNLLIVLFEALVKLNIVDQSVISTLLKKSFDLDEQKSQIFERICQMSDEDLSLYSEDVKNKISKLRSLIIKKKSN
ncbi:putative subunit 2 of cleavage stimulation factor [Hamiltosporidium tvaerminnensis]|uniref:Putative subunit 2 of cleavage stimulation factor n=3 Tax=Hamiltosporidium TaxID=1176354 RepID=A0A4Q9L7Z4_9MICR|nr:Cleavage stimulation factor subunit 2 [Hamiltosporidium tvaerminnensis]TBU03319.1 putative subunit 2 of cleavage stimulation factor [Hamiltosporidium magnivora]TBT98801.1 putative subunit 2 of cleavage stimulation factor [Hamiltosporidium tvaerminnensis]TBU03823.1 putative subunit 2 of cleavage stimulation factor [Hamiltosporidium magnivora]TBU12961.1 putative subunit 2 of cleavage stimulation factor [Hamiltosporidium tvaerminnensis]